MKCTPKDDELERYFYTVDEQGSTTLITNNCANIANEYYYDAFGNVLESTKNVHNRITYTGQQFDSYTQQYYLRARFYNPAIGRFTQEDIYRGDGLNLYAYCRNNPVRYYDPSGYLCSGKINQYNEEVKNFQGSRLEYLRNKYNGGASTNSIANNKNVPYPKVLDIRTGKNMVFPEGVGERIPKQDRVGWYRNQNEANLYRINETDILCKKDYIDEWYRRGYETPDGGWKEYEIHHIKPREFGGDSSFENMTPLKINTHRKIVTPWWNAYGN